MAKNFENLVCENHDNDSIEATREELKKKGVTLMGFGLKPSQAVYVPTIAEGRKTYFRAMRPDGPKNVPVITCVIMEKVNGKYKLTDKGVEVGVSSLFNVDYTNKPHAEDLTSAKAIQCLDHDARVEEIAGNAILAGNQEVVIKIQRTGQTTVDGRTTYPKLFADDGTPILKDKRIVPSRILKADEWINE